MKQTISVLLVGVGGFGQTYYDGIVLRDTDKQIQIKGVVEPFPEKCPRMEQIKEQNIPVFPTVEDFYAVSHAELAVISSPIQFHCQQVCYAMEKGSHVLCEKPVSATVQDALLMIDIKNQTGKALAIGYQWSFSDEIQRLKKDILCGLYGRALRFRTAVFWPRSHKYYNRGWAGKKTDQSGRWILDSIAHNATAHYLHNMFYILGEKVDRSILPVTVQAELYRANQIENFDTVAARVETENGVEILFYASHATKSSQDLLFCYEFEKGTITYHSDKQTIVGKLQNGTTTVYGDPPVDTYKKLQKVILQIWEGETILCGPEAAYPQVLCINGMHESMPDVAVFPKEYIHTEQHFDGTPIVFVDNLKENLILCYNEGKLPSELSIPWAVRTKPVDLTGYSYFPGGKEKELGPDNRCFS